jgi:hypothetical protein
VSVAPGVAPVPSIREVYCRPDFVVLASVAGSPANEVLARRQMMIEMIRLCM